MNLPCPLRRISRLASIPAVLRAAVLGALLALPLAAPLHAQSSAEDERDQAYIEKFLAYQRDSGQIPETTQTLEQYATAEHWDALFGTATPGYIQRINDEQNKLVNMGWSSSYYSDALNTMYRATGDVKYLRQALDLARATMANRDVDKGYVTHWGEVSPGWGTEYYSQKWVVHPVHTGIIGYGVLETLRLVRSEAALLEELGGEFDTLLAKVIESLDWEDRCWVEGPAEDEAHYIFDKEEFKDGKPAYEGEVQPGNRIGAMGIAYWTAYKITGDARHREKSLKIGRFMKRRMGLYGQTADDAGAWGWGYWLAKEPLANPLPAEDWRRLRGGEDFSHASLTVTFPLTLALEGELYTPEELRAFGNTITRGAARMNNGIIFGNVGGRPSNDPSDAMTQGYWFPLVSVDREAWQRLVDFQLRYQAKPRAHDLARLIESVQIAKQKP